MGSAPFGSCGNGYHFPPATRPSLGRGYSRQRLAATCKPYVPQRHSGNVGWMTVSCSRAVTRMSRYLGSAATLQASHSQDTAAWLAWVWWPPNSSGLQGHRRKRPLRHFAGPAHARKQHAAAHRRRSNPRPCGPATYRRAQWEETDVGPRLPGGIAVRHWPLLDLVVWCVALPGAVAD